MSACMNTTRGGDCSDPAVHSTCEHCWMWRECGDEGCDEPACSALRTRRWIDAYEAEHPDGGEEVLVEASEPGPAELHGRMAELLADAREGMLSRSVAGARERGYAQKLLDALGRAEWVMASRVPGIPPTEALEAELALLLDGAALEARTARYARRSHVAYSASVGEEARGGLIMTELRLVRDPERIPEGVQSALF